MNRAKYEKMISVASGNEPADLVIKNGKMIDVFGGRIVTGDIAITEGIFVGIGNYNGKVEVDINQKYICPAFIDSHVHIESSMVTPSEFAKVLIPHGVTTVIADPHEIANVAGIEGIRYILDSTERLPFDCYIMLPSCVPATLYEHSGAIIEARDLVGLYNHPRVLGLGEVMNFPAVRDKDGKMIDKLWDALIKHKKIDGHGAGLRGFDINVLSIARIATDHECTTSEEALERIQRGMYVQVRQGTSAKDVEALLPAINKNNSRRFVFVTDDKHLDDLINEGSVDHNIRLAINKGIDPITAIQMATINAAECYRLQTKGAIAPGYDADFLILNDLQTLEIDEVYKNGILIGKNGKAMEKYFEKSECILPSTLYDSIDIGDLTIKDFQIQLLTSKAHIIGLIPNSLITQHLVDNVDIQEGLFNPSTSKDYLKIAVIERHSSKKQIGLGIVKGFGLKEGAIAATVAHDSHNMIIVGTNDEDMLTAAEELESLQGGYIVVKNQIVLASVKLPIAGLLSNQPYEMVVQNIKTLYKVLKLLGFNKNFNPFLALSFLALPVIPDLKITDMGMFDVRKASYIRNNE